MNTLLAALCVLPCVSAMYIGMDPMDSMYDVDQKIFRKNAFGQIQAFDVSYDTQYAPNGFGGISRYNVMDISDPDVYAGGMMGMGNRLASPMGFGGMGGMGVSNLVNPRAAMPTGGAGMTAGMGAGMGFPFNGISNFVSGFPYGSIMG